MKEMKQHEVINHLLDKRIEQAGGLDNYSIDERDAFCDGCESIFELMETRQEFGKWISVNQKLPPDETDVFIFGHAYDNHVSYHGVGCLYCGHWVDTDYTNLEKEYGIGITHWMELSEPNFLQTEFEW